VRARVVLAVALVAAACGDDPLRQSVTGHWVGTPALFGTPWSLDMTITQSGSSVSGTATRSNYAAVPYMVSGDQVGDSVFLHFMPPEDIDLRFALHPDGNRLRGVMWFGTNREGASVPVTFDRQ
jgi:hypothetical protein